MKICTHRNIIQTNLPRPRAGSRTTILKQDTVPPGVIRISQRPEHALVRVDPGKQQRPLAPVGQLPPERLVLAPQPTHAVLIAPHVPAALIPNPHLLRKRPVHGAVPLPPAQTPAPTAPEIGTQARPHGPVAGGDELPVGRGGSDEATREAALHRGRERGEVGVG